MSSLKLMIVALVLVIGVHAKSHRRVLEVTDDTFKSNNHEPETKINEIEIDGIEKCIAEKHGMWLDTSFKFPTEIVLSKCGRPYIMLYPGRAVVEYVDIDVLQELYAAYQDTCNGTALKNSLDLTQYAFPFVEGTVVFVPDDGTHKHGLMEKIRYLSNSVIWKVSFGLVPYIGEKYPLKIGSLLQEAKKHDTDLVLTFFSTCPVDFLFSKCGKILHGFPKFKKNITLTDDWINELEKLQNRTCGKWWDAGIIDIEFVPGPGGGGFVKFQLVDAVPGPEESNTETIIIMLICVLSFIILSACLFKCIIKKRHYHAHRVIEIALADITDETTGEPSSDARVVDTEDTAQ